MDEATEYVIYEECPSSKPHQTTHKSAASNDLNLQSSFFMSSTHGSGNHNVLSKPLNVLKDFQIINQAEQSGTQSYGSRLSVNSCNSQIPVISIPEEIVILEENVKKTENCNDVLISNPYLGIYNDSYKFLMGSLSLSMLLKNNAEKSGQNSTYWNLLTDTSNGASKSLSLETCETPQNDKEKNNLTMNESSLQEQLSLDLEEVIEPTLNNSHLFDIIVEQEIQTSQTENEDCQHKENAKSIIQYKDKEEICNVNSTKSSSECLTYPFSDKLSAPDILGNKIKNNINTLSSHCSSVNFPVQSLIQLNCEKTQNQQKSTQVLHPSTLHVQNSCTPNSTVSETNAEAVSILNNSSSKSSLQSQISNKTKATKKNKLNHSNIKLDSPPNKPNVITSKYKKSSFSDYDTDFATQSYWECLICLIKYPSASNLKTHYISHKVEDLSKALLKFSSSSNSRTVSSDDRSLQLEVKHTVNENQSLLNSERKLTTKNMKLSAHNKKTKMNANGLRSRDPHSCTICNKVLSSRGNLLKHVIRHQSVKPWKCKVCGAEFNAKRDHDHHYMRRHTTIRPNVCSVCGKGFTHKNSLAEHMLFHERKKPFKCPICGKAFIMKKCVNRHLLRHDTSRNFICKVCKKNFRVKDDLITHVKYAHNFSQNKTKLKPSSKKPSIVNQNPPQRFLKSVAIVPGTVVLENKNVNKITKHTTESTLRVQELQISNDDDAKFRELSDILHSNSASLISNSNNPIESCKSVTVNKQNYVLDASGIDTQASLIPLASGENEVYSASYELALPKGAIVNDGIRSEDVYVLIGMDDAEDEIDNLKRNWNHTYETTEDFANSTSIKAPLVTSNVGEINSIPGLSTIGNISSSFANTLRQDTSSKMDTVNCLNPSLTSEKTLKGVDALSGCINEGEFTSNFSHSNVEHMSSDSQPQVLNLDLLSQTLHLDFQESQGNCPTEYL